MKEILKNEKESQFKKYDKIFLTNIPAFYKINLYNRIASHEKIMAIFTGDSRELRNADFFNEEKQFDFLFLKGNKFTKAFRLLTILRRIKYNELIIGGWDSFSMWLAVIFSFKKKNSVVIESSYYESQTSGLKGCLKKFFMRRVSKAYVSGKSQEKLIKLLNFEGKIIKTKGVGIFNYVSQTIFQKKECVNKFLYVGRFSPEKNLFYLIKTFNFLPNYILNIIGFGPQEEELRRIAKENIIFHGAIDNKKLSQFYQTNDVFILPSISEPWGLVVEEAFNNGLPVIVSENVGCVDEIVNENNGIVFSLTQENSLKEAVLKMTNIDYYNKLRLNISKMDFDKLAQEQIKCYLNK